LYAREKWRKKSLSSLLIIQGMISRLRKKVVVEIMPSRVIAEP